MNLRPAEPDTGIVFYRRDLAVGPSGGGSGTGSADPRARIAACWRNVTDTKMATTIANQHGARVSTIEHVMAALAGCGVDNAVVELDGPEVPVMDGSAEPFVFLIECAGLTEQRKKRRAIEVLKTIEVGDERRALSISPHDGFMVSFEIDFDSDVIARQRLGVQLGNGAFKHDIAKARTFGFEHEVEQLRAAGLALGGSLDNAVVIAGDQVLNAGGLRFEDEFVRHKILDCIGDLYLAGAPLLGHVHGHRSGHALNHKLLTTLFADETAWRYTDMPDMSAHAPQRVGRRAEPQLATA